MATRSKKSELATYAALARKTKVLTAEQERNLARRWRDHKDEAARERLVVANLRAVFKIASEFMNRYQDMEDLVQEGVVGLVRATERFDPERGIRFLSYAGWWIRACIREFLLRNRSLVRIGTTQKQRSIYSQLGRAKKALEEQYPDCDPAKRFKRLGKILDATPELVEQMEGRLNGFDLSLDVRLSDDSEPAYIDLLADEAPQPDVMATTKQLAHLRGLTLDDALATLDKRERYIIENRHLVPDSVTLRELGERLGISRERVRQIELRAKDKIRRAFNATPDSAELLAG